MRHSMAIALLLVLAAAGGMAQAQETTPSSTSPAPPLPTSESPPPTVPRPDYSRQALLRLVASASEEHPRIPSRVQWGLGTVEFPLFGTRFRVAWLPFLPTLNPIGYHGSIKPTIDPFQMTGLDLPMKVQDSAERRELRRIERRLRRAKKE